MTDNLPHRPYY